MSAKNLPKSRFGFTAVLLTAIVSALITTFVIFFTLASTHALAFTPSDLLSGIGQIKRSTWDNLTRGFALWVLPQGHSWGLDADSVDSLHAASFALKSDFDSFSSLSSGKLSSLSSQLADLSGSIRTGELAAFFQNASNLVSGTISDSRLSSNVALLNNSQTFTGPKTFSSGTLTVAAGTTLSLSKGSLLDVQGSLSLPPGSITTADLADSSVTSLKILDGTIVNADVSSSASIAYSKLNLGGSITGSDLSPSIAITTSGAISAGGGVSSSSSLTTTGSGTLSIAGASTLSSSLSVLGASTLAGTTVGNLTSTSGNITSTLPDSSSAIAFNLATGTTYATAGANLLVLKNNTTTELSLDKNGNLTVNGNLVAVGTIQGTQLISTVSTGTAPLQVSSTTVVPNLHAAAADEPQPNLVLNSDFSRRNKWMTFMPETFTDTSGITVDKGTAASAASNTLTGGNVNTSYWRAHGGLSTWRDVRASAQFQATGAVSNDWRLGLAPDPANVGGTDPQPPDAIYISNDNGTLKLSKVVSGTATVLASVANTLTLNNWYWLEIERQGTTVIGKIYSSGASAVAKSSATLSQTLTSTLNSTDVIPSGYYWIAASLNSSKWGGLSTGDGGVYVEGWGPESIGVSHAGSTLGGDSVGFDESTDAGPLGQQWAWRGYIPATSRYITALPARINVAPSAAYTASTYLKVSGKGGSGALVRLTILEYDSSDSYLGVRHDIDDAGETSWTRKSVTFTTSASARYVRVYPRFNDPLTATGTGFFGGLQLEQGSVATPWRNAPADDDPIRWKLTLSGTNNRTITSTSPTEIDSRDLGINLFAPWDGFLSYNMTGSWDSQTGVGGAREGAALDGTGITSTNGDNIYYTGAQNAWNPFNDQSGASITAGKHRLANRAWIEGSGNLLFSPQGPNLVEVITLTRGK